jgi:hypothetical protein
LYYGERAKLQAFLTQSELKFNCEMNKFDTERKRLNYASSRYRGNAWAWIEPSITKGQSIYETWEGFKAAISRAFGEADSKEVERRKFKGIQQEARSAAAYWAEFQRIKADLHYNDAMYIYQFNDGLNTDVQRQLALLNCGPDNMTDFANKAIALDNRLFNFRTLRMRYEPQFHHHLYTKGPNHESRPSDPKPMELDSNRRPRPRDKIEDEKHKRNNECFNCGKMGHYAAKCPSRRPYRAAETTLAEEVIQEDAGKEDPQE